MEPCVASTSLVTLLASTVRIVFFPQVATMLPILVVVIFPGSGIPLILLEYPFIPSH
jgi:hypothetical protein